MVCIDMDRNEENLLTIIIPTYNRYQILDKSLELLNNLREKLCFTLMVCNNASTDKTSVVIRKWESIVPNMEVVSHKHNVFFDRNVASGYLRVQTEYCWVLGDSYSISEETLRNVLMYLREKKPDALIVNWKRDPVRKPDTVYNDSTILLRELGWYTTMLPSCVISKKFIEKRRLERYFDSAFIHEGVFFDYLSTLSQINVHFISSLFVEAIDDVSRATSSWRKIPFKVFGEGWFAFIMSLPYNYSVNSKLYCISQHDKMKKVFSFHKILFLRFIGCLNFKDFKEAKPIMRHITSTPILIFELISIIPPMPKLSKMIIVFLHKHHIIKKKWVEMVNSTNY